MMCSEGSNDQSDGVARLINAPIALFAYNRPIHTRRTLETLKSNLLAKDSDLIVYSDAARSPEHMAAVSEVRKYLFQLTGFKSVKIVTRRSNYGLAKSIIEGVTELCNKYGKVIVMEDDLETSPFFLQYMNDALRFYENSEMVMHISGCAYPVECHGTEETYFLHIPLCWGWGTWKRSWTTFSKTTSIMDRFNRKMKYHFNFGNTYPYWDQLESNKAGKIDTWFIFWYANVYVRNGLALFPSRSLVNNIGFDDSGTHCNRTSSYNVKLSDKPIKVQNIPVVESAKAYELHQQYFRRLNLTRPGLLARIFKTLTSTSRSKNL
jgi:hypothetical protein